MNRFKGSFALLSAAVITIVIASGSCKKSSSNSSALTKENLAGVYTLTALSVTLGPLSQDILDSVPACQRDDQYDLKVDLTYLYNDVGVQCNPPGDGSGHWSISGTTLTIDSTQSTVQKFDGKTLVLSTPITYNNISVTATETLTKH